MSGAALGPSDWVRGSSGRSGSSGSGGSLFQRKGVPRAVEVEEGGEKDGSYELFGGSGASAAGGESAVKRKSQQRTKAMLEASRSVSGQPGHVRAATFAGGGLAGTRHNEERGVVMTKAGDEFTDI